MKMEGTTEEKEMTREENQIINKKILIIIVVFRFFYYTLSNFGKHDELFLFKGAIIFLKKLNFAIFKCVEFSQNHVQIYGRKSIMFESQERQIVQSFSRHAYSLRSTDSCQCRKR